MPMLMLILILILILMLMLMIFVADVACYMFRVACFMLHVACYLPVPSSLKAFVKGLRNSFTMKLKGIYIYILSYLS